MAQKKIKKGHKKDLKINWLGNGDFFLDDIIGQEHAKEELYSFQRLLRLRKIAASYKVTPPNILIHGSVGTGKTISAEALANECAETLPKVKFFSVTLSDFGTCYVNENSNNLASIFEYARDIIEDKDHICEYAVLVMDEFDSIGSQRSGGSSGGGSEDDKVVNTLNQYLEGDRRVPNLSAIAITNFYNKLDPAIKRRFKKHIEYGTFTQEQVGELYKKHLELKRRNNPVAELIFGKMFYKKLAEYTPAQIGGMDLNGSHIRDIVDRAMELKVKELDEALGKSIKAKSDILNDFSKEDGKVKMYNIRNAIDAYVKERMGAKKQRNPIGYLAKY